MDATIHPRCKTCVCWEEVKPVGAVVNVTAGKRGECHRMPPQIIATAQGVGAGFPQTSAESWCAEWHAKAQEPLNG